MRLEWDPEGLKETAGAMIGLDERRVEGDLERFRDLTCAQGSRDRRMARRGLSRGTGDVRAGRRLGRTSPPDRASPTTPWRERERRGR